jgi:hypothetical protein
LFPEQAARAARGTTRAENASARATEGIREPWHGAREKAKAPGISPEGFLVP